MALNDEVIRLLLGHALGVVTRHHGLWQTLGIFCISKAQVIDRVGTLGFKHPAIGSIAIGANALTTCIRHTGEGVFVERVFVMEMTAAPIGSMGR